MSYGKFISIIVSIVSFILLFSCSSSLHNTGQKYLENKDFERARAVFLQALRENPSNAEAWRDLGIVYFEQKQNRKAQKALEKALQLDSGDGKTIFYSGLTQERLDNWEKALDYYRRYPNISSFSHLRQIVEGRLEWLMRRKAMREVKAALANERRLDVRAIPENTLAVTYFKNTGANRDFDPLQKGLADMLITDLSKVKALKVVERIKMQKLMEEIGLGMTGIVEESSAPRFGKLLGASRLINGSFIDLNAENVRLDTRVILTKDGAIGQKNKKTGAMERLFRLQKDLVFDIVADMGIRLSKADREEIMKIPTESLLAFMAYSKGLDYSDRGQFEQARGSFQDALRLDPNFALAGAQLGKMEGMMQGAGSYQKIESKIKKPQISTAQTSATRSRLQSGAAQINAGFIPGTESREPVQEESGEANLGGVPVLIELPIGDPGY